MKIVLKINNEWLQEYKRKDSLVPAWIYLQNGDESYPDDEWIDNPVVVIGWWLHSIAELLSNREGQGMSFMEGPFYLDVVTDGDNFLLNSEDKKISWVVRKSDLAKEVMRTANEMSRALHSQGMDDLAQKLNEGVKAVRLSLKNAR